MEHNFEAAIRYAATLAAFQVLATPAAPHHHGLQPAAARKFLAEVGIKIPATVTVPVCGGLDSYLEWYTRFTQERDARRNTEHVVTERKTRSGIRVYLTYMPGEDETARWQTECEHGRCTGHATRKIAESFLSHPEEYCPWCRAIVVGTLTVDAARARVDAGEDSP